MKRHWQSIRFVWILSAAAACASAVAEDKVTQPVVPATDSTWLRTYDTVEQIKLIPRCDATVWYRTPCTVHFLASDGMYIILGSPAAPQRVASFLATLKDGEKYIVPDAFVEFLELKQLDETLTSVIQKHFPDADFERTNRRFVAKHGTMEFMVHGRSKTGEVSPNAYKEEGPNYRGFLLAIDVVHGPYQGAAVIPQELRKAYWTTFIDATPLSDRRAHFWIRLSYGGRLDPGFHQALRLALPSSLPKTKPAADGAGTGARSQESGR
jgi:hypothetical protein